MTLKEFMKATNSELSDFRDLRGQKALEAVRRNGYSLLHVEKRIFEEEVQNG